MSQICISIDCVTFVLGSELLHISVDADQLALASIRPSLHPLGLRATHLTIPLKPRARGPKAGWYWVHLTYPDHSHQDVAWVHPDALREVGQALDAVYRDMVREFLSSSCREVDAHWLAAEGYKIAFMWDDAFPQWADTYFKRRSKQYRVSKSRLEKSVGEMQIEEPEILDVDDFIENRPQCIRALSLDGSKETLSVWRFPWGPDGAHRWYAAPCNSLMLTNASFFEASMRILGPDFWDRVRTILVELGIPADYDRLDLFFCAMKEGRFDVLEDLRRRALTAA